MDLKKLRQKGTNVEQQHCGNNFLAFRMTKTRSLCVLDIPIILFPPYKLKYMFCWRALSVWVRLPGGRVCYLFLYITAGKCRTKHYWALAGTGGGWMSSSAANNTYLILLCTVVPELLTAVTAALPYFRREACHCSSILVTTHDRPVQSSFISIAAFSCFLSQPIHYHSLTTLDNLCGTPIMLGNGSIDYSALPTRYLEVRLSAHSHDY